MTRRVAPAGGKERGPKRAGRTTAVGSWPITHLAGLALLIGAGLGLLMAVGFISFGPAGTVRAEEAPARPRAAYMPLGSADREPARSFKNATEKTAREPDQDQPDSPGFGNAARYLPPGEQVRELLTPERRRTNRDRQEAPGATTTRLVTAAPLKAAPPKAAPPKAAPTARAPTIAIVIDDIGMDMRRSQMAIALPAPITLALLPYAPDIDKTARRARLAGHELIVHMPMEPLTHDANPGPQAMLVGLDTAALTQRIDWNLSRFDGFVGVNNHMGSRVSASPTEMRTILEALHRRGLFYLDSRTTARSVAAETARAIGIRFAERDVFLDNLNDETAVTEQLARAEAIARDKGIAIAIGHPKDATIAVLRRWIDPARQRGMRMIPVSKTVRILPDTQITAR